MVVNARGPSRPDAIPAGCLRQPYGIRAFNKLQCPETLFPNYLV